MTGMTGMFRMTMDDKGRLEITGTTGMTMNGWDD